MPDPVLDAHARARVLDPEADDVRQGQLRRLADVLVLGPYMLWTARSVDHDYLRLGLTLIGIGTIVYNGWNFLRIRAAEQGRAAPELAGTRFGAGIPRRARARARAAPRRRAPARRLR